ncbi:hypothetical protein H6F89_00100 [Cyanobacteria bacterium FACHB-63]|nr:hypothetical protein [Cyanobacteria bacterium FACHB-63]
MTEKQIVSILKIRGIKKVEIRNGNVLADFGIDNEYWLSIPPVFGQEWVRVLLFETGERGCISDRVWFSLEDAIDGLSIAAAIDYARFHDEFAAMTCA